VPDIAPPAGFTFNQFLILGEEPLMFHTGLRKMFPLSRDAVSRLIPPERLRWIAFGHFEADECTPGYFFGKPEMASFLSGSEVGFEIPGLGVFHGPNLTPDQIPVLANGRRTRS
jgi:hypothetical protein